MKSNEITEDFVNKVFELYRTKSDPEIFVFDSLPGPVIYQIVPPNVVEYVHQYILDPKYSGRTKEKIITIDNILQPYGLVRFAAGTNRAVYRYTEDESFCVKVALDKVGLSNNPDEFRNQEFLKPFVSKVFSVSPCGTMATCERVIPIKSRQEFAALAGDIFDVIASKFVGNYILEDIGTIFFKNWGLRKGFGPVLLDYPYLYEVDVSDLYCNEMTNMGLPCGGSIDYDDGFNALYCKKCGKRYKAKQIGKAIRGKLIAFRGGSIMSNNDKIEVQVIRDGKVISNKKSVDTSINPKDVVKSKYFPVRKNGWNPDDFDIIITLNGVKLGKKDGKYFKLGENNSKTKPATEGLNMNKAYSNPSDKNNKKSVKEETNSDSDTDGFEYSQNNNSPIVVNVSIDDGSYDDEDISDSNSSDVTTDNYVMDNNKAEIERYSMIEKAISVSVVIPKDASEISVNEVSTGVDEESTDNVVKFTTEDDTTNVESNIEDTTVETSTNEGDVMTTVNDVNPEESKEEFDDADNVTSMTQEEIEDFNKHKEELRDAERKEELEEFGLEEDDFIRSNDFIDISNRNLGDY